MRVAASSEPSDCRTAFMRRNRSIWPASLMPKGWVPKRGAANGSSMMVYNVNELFAEMQASTADVLTDILGTAIMGC